MSIDICKELSQNFKDFSYEANSERAFPDVRDGLKPGQRACIWLMYSKGFSSNKPHVKSAKISGGVVAELWPHGTVAVYETFARMSQDWVNNIPEVDWHGANGNIVISGQPASDRYTEARLAKATEDGMLSGIKKNNVPMILNFSEDQQWPEVLPAIFPRLIINGSQGIGVTIAQNWYPHNLSEIADAIIKYTQTSKIDYNSIYPDFPSGGIIINKSDLKDIYKTGKGKIILRGKVSVEDNTIVITELPYQVYVEPFINEIKTLIEKEEIIGIDDIYNKTDDKGLRIELVCSKSPTKIVKQLYKSTSLQKVFAANHMALLRKVPRNFTLKDYFDEYIKHNITCIINENNFDLAESEKRYEIVVGLIKALADIDNIISTIKSSPSISDAQEKLQINFGFSPPQARAIVDMRLGKLANLEKKELENERDELKNNIDRLKDILASEEKLKNIFIERLKNFSKNYGFNRRTEVIDYIAESEGSEEEVTEPEKCVVIMTESGYIKRIPGDTFKPSKKGTKGIKTQDDITSAVIRTNTIDNLMVFSTFGKLYKLPVSEIPEGNASSKGAAVKMLTSMEANENASTIYSVYKDTDAEYIVFVTKKGIIKKTKLSDYASVRKGKGAAAITLSSGDAIASGLLIKDEQLIIITKKGKMIWCESSAINPVGKVAKGVCGMKVEKDDEVISAIAIRDTRDMLGVFTTTGLAKRVDLEEFTLHRHGGKGQMAYKITKTSGDIAGIQMLSADDLILMVGDKNSLCVEGKEIPVARKTSIGLTMAKDLNIIKVSKV